MLNKKIIVIAGFAGIYATQSRISIPTDEASGEYLIVPLQFREETKKENIKQTLSEKTKKKEELEDQELLSVPDKYLSPELQKRKQLAMEHAKNIPGAVATRIHPKSSTVEIRDAHHNAQKVDIKDTVVRSEEKTAAPALSAKKILPDVELIQEISIEKSQEIKKEILPGEPREIYEIFQYGKTSEPIKTPLLSAYAAYAKKDYATSVTLAYKVFSENKNDESQTLAAYLMAHGLYQAGFYSTALGPLVELSETKWRRSALGMIAECMIATKDRSAVRNVLEKISLSQIPDRYKSLFAYHLGRILLNLGQAQAATSAFAQVESTAPEYAEAQYYTGVILTEGLQGASVVSSNWDKEGTQVFEARGSLEAAVDAAHAIHDENLRDLANLSLGRLAYQGELYNQAVFYYSVVPAVSPYAREAMFESAWALYRAGEYNRSLGFLHPLDSPYFERRDFADLWTLRSLNYLKLCRFDEAGRAVNSFNAEVDHSMADLQSGLAFLHNRNFKLLADLSLSRMPASDSPESKIQIPLWVRRMILQDPIIGQDRQRELRLLKERERLLVLEKNPLVADSRLKKNALAFFEKIIGRRLSYLVKSTNPYISARLEEVIRDYQAEKPKADILRYEIYSQATKYPEAVKRLQAQRMIEEKQFLPGVFMKGNEILWRFNGEYWADELKGYDYFIPTECASN